MSDMDTDRFDGSPCWICGDSAAHVVEVAEGSRLVDRAICGPCADFALTTCPDCSYLVWTKDCTRIGTELYCADCSAKHPVVVGDVMAALDADDRQDTFNQTRR